MEILEVKKQSKGYKVKVTNKGEYSIPYKKGTFLYRETKAFIDGGGVIDDEFTQEELDLQEEANKKVQKAQELSTLTITNNTVLYDAHQEAIGNMAAVIGIANATYNRAVSVGLIAEGETEAVVMTPVDAYNYVYKQTVQWKGADNKWHTVQLESLVETTQKAMTEKATVLSKY